MVHFPKGFWPIVNMGEAAILYCFIFLYLAAPGRSVEHRRRPDTERADQVTLARCLKRG